MKVLIATHHYYDLTGSETFAYTLAKTLMFKGCHVTIYSPYIGGMITEKTLQLGIPVLSRLEEIKDEKFDVIHLSHNLVAIEVRDCFPYTPILFLSHGVLPFLEQPSLEDLNISKYLVVSEEVKDHLMQRGILNDHILIFRNMIDTQRFYPLSGINEEPKRVLVNSRRMGQQTQSIIEEACRRLSLEINFIGNQGNIKWDVEKYINEVDICISLGRGVLEAMSCGRAAIVFDYNGGDGLVTVDNIDEIQKCNFSGRKFKRRFSVETLVDEIKKYTKEMGIANRGIIEERFSAEKNIDSLIDIYEKAIDSFEHQPLMYDRLNHLKNLLIETRNYSVGIERRRYDGIVRDKELALTNLQCALQDNNQNIVQLQDLLREKEIEAEKLVVDLKVREREIRSLEETISQKDDHITDLEEKVREEVTHVSALEGMIRKKETEIESFRNGLDEKRREIRSLEETIKEKAAQISHLGSLAWEKEAALNHIYNSHGWKILLFYYRLRDKIFPINSKRRSLGKFIFNVLCKPMGSP